MKKTIFVKRLLQGKETFEGVWKSCGRRMGVVLTSSIPHCKAITVREAPVIVSSVAVWGRKVVESGKARREMVLILGFSYIFEE